MDIGSAKPTQDELSQARHHLIDYVNPDEPYNVSRFVNDCHQTISEIRKRDKIPLLVGGTGLYFQALECGMFAQPEIDKSIRESLRNEAAENGTHELYGELITIDPESAARIHENDTYRILRALEIFRSTGKTWSKYIEEHREEQEKASNRRKLLKVGLDRDREQLYQRINSRVEVMIELGLVDEVKKLLAMGYPETLSSMQSLGYRHVTTFLAGEWTWEKTLELLARDTRRYAKRQFTWFNTAIRWFYPDERDQLLSEISNFLTI